MSNLNTPSSEVLKTLETIPVCIAVLSSDFLILTASDLYLEATETKREDIKGRNIFEVFPDNPATPEANSVQNLKDSLKIAQSSKRPHQMKVQRYDIPNPQQPGKFVQRHWEPLNTPILNSSGEVQYIIHMVTNVTDKIAAEINFDESKESEAALKELNLSERKIAEEALNYRKALLEAQNEAIPDAILIVDTKGEMLSFNQHFVTLWGIPKDIIDRKDDTSALTFAMTQLVNPDEFIERVNYYYAHPDETANEEVHFKDGRIIQRYGNAVSGEDGFFYGWAWYFRDVTKNKELEKQKDDFISIASHELKTPITSLKASLQLMERMKEQFSAPLFARLVEQSNRSMHKITSLIDDLLNVSRMNHGQLQLKKTMFKVADLLNGCCEHVRAEGKHELIFQGDGHLEMYADHEKIDQVVVNFVNNAVKYAPGSPEIILAVEDLGDKVKVSVKDSGPGIEPEKLAHLFDRYYRADVAGYQNSGLGLGLFICAEIIKRHEGEIGAESDPGNGSTFWFVIPKS